MSEGTKAELVDAFGLLLPHLDERQLRLTLGAAARVFLKGSRWHAWMRRTHWSTSRKM
ncbi:hypothetical protein ABZT28_54350 [Streptomyces sp. NPDC005388]|uniref:hypothetical protein n=1 Tax=Streptomyces sp. NPDC005388 TaxID=3156717 RepID=UPI0033AFF656